MQQRILSLLPVAVCAALLFGLGGLPRIAAAPADAGGQALVPGGFVYGDKLPDAPELAARGPYGVGVRTMKVVNPNQLDILKFQAGKNENPRYDRPLTLEIWYPAIIPSGRQERVIYNDMLGLSNDPKRPNAAFRFPGRALRDAAPFGKDGPYPLLIVSHGYPGSRFMMSYLTENLASKGYVVVAIDHTESTFGNVGGFASTLLNRSLDQLFVIAQMALKAEDAKSFLHRLVDADNTAIIGYSMGGFGALNAAGAGYNPGGAIYSWVPGGKLAARSEGNPEYVASIDARIKAVVCLAPWGQGSMGGNALQTWTSSALANIKVPSLFIVGSQDDVALYDAQGWGVRRIFEETVNSDRYMLVYENASHNIAPNPPPVDSWKLWPEYERYSEPAWSSPRINNINQHFITAFLDMHLKGRDDASYLNVTPQSNDGVWDTNYWKGFVNRTARGLEMYHMP